MYAFLRLLLVHDDYNSTDNRQRQDEFVPANVKPNLLPYQAGKTSAFGMMSSSRLLSVYQNPFP